MRHSSEHCTRFILLTLLLQKRGRSTADPQLAAEGRQMLAQAEVEARHGAGYHRALAEAGEGRTGSDAASSAPSKASESVLAVGWWFPSCSRIGWLLA